VIRAIAESDNNPVISIHDHGAGGHLNCLSELVEATGGHIDMSQLPVGDPTLSAKEIVGNESQERMGLLMKEEDVARVQRIADRERSPMYVVGETTNDMKFVFEQADGVKPIDIKLEYMFGKPPRTIMKDHTVEETYAPVVYKESKLHHYLENVLQLEAVACKDWLTNKVDRSVTGKVARQQCQGELQLPLSDLGAVALDYRGKAGIATSIGHAPQVAMIDPAAGSVMAIAESLTNIVFAPLSDKLSGVSLSANWMWPCRNEGEDARLYKAVQAASDFACALGINIPTGKDSLSMTQKYGDDKVIAPGTVIISAGAEVSDIRKIVSPVLAHEKNSYIYYIDFSFDTMKLGGSALAQVLNKLGNEVPTIKDSEYFADAFNAVQDAIQKGLVLACRWYDHGIARNVFRQRGRRSGSEPRQVVGTGHCQDSVCRKPGYPGPGERQESIRKVDGRCRSRFCHYRQADFRTPHSGFQRRRPIPFRHRLHARRMVRIIL
jgi:phosphoribosylformylglycinamidine synthase